MIPVTRQVQIDLAVWTSAIDRARRQYTAARAIEDGICGACLTRARKRLSSRCWQCENAKRDVP